MIKSMTRWEFDASCDQFAHILTAWGTWGVLPSLIAACLSFLHWEISLKTAMHLWSCLILQGASTTCLRQQTLANIMKMRSSPLSFCGLLAQIISLLLMQIYGQSNDQIYNAANDQIYDQIYGAANDQIYNAANDQIYNAANDQIYNAANDQIYNAANDQIYNAANDQIYNAANDQIYNQANDQIYNAANDQIYDQVQTFVLLAPDCKSIIAICMLRRWLLSTKHSVFEISFTMPRSPSRCQWCFFSFWCGKNATNTHYFQMYCIPIFGRMFRYHHIVMWQKCHTAHHFPNHCRMISWKGVQTDLSSKSLDSAMASMPHTDHLFQRWLQKFSFRKVSRQWYV